MKKLFVLSALMAAVSVLPASAATIIVFNNSSPQNTTALTGSATFGDMMDGMTVAAGFAAGGTDNRVWADSGVPGCGSAIGAGWSLSQCGDTFAAASWTLTSSTVVTSLFIDAGPGNAVFDTDFGGGFGTDGSALGRTFTTSSTVDITATYSGPVGVAGNPPVGDLYRFLRLDFTGGPFAGTLTFGQDTDSLLFGGDIAPVPEPASMLLLGTGLVGAAMRRRRTRRA